MLKKMDAEPRDERRDDAQEKYFYHEDPRAGRRKIKQEDLDTLEVWEDQDEH